MKTGIIKYNLTDRGRSFRGMPRDGVLNIPKLVTYINGGECQERVKSRDMLGYYGHATREKLGLIPKEGITSGDSPVPRVIPAIVTTHLKAWSDGTVEHEAEFLDTEPGQVASDLFRSKVGGFSSAIRPVSMEFAGYDYVLEPNYSTNRGYILDSISGSSCVYLLDDIHGASLLDLELQARDEELSGLRVLSRRYKQAADISTATIQALEAENCDLQNRISREELPDYRDQTFKLLDDIREFATLDIDEKAIFDQVAKGNKAAPKNDSYQYARQRMRGGR
jgi:hypothetical protein